MTMVAHFRWYGRLHCGLQLALVAGFVLFVVANALFRSWLTALMATVVLIGVIALICLAAGPVWTRFRNGWISDKVRQGQALEEAEKRFSAKYED